MKFASVFLMCLALPAQDRTPRTTERAKPDVGTGVKQPAVDYYDSLADYFRQSRRAIDLIATKGISDSEIAAVLTIARRSSASPNQVIDSRKAGKQFADIAKEHKVTLPGQDFVTEANVLFLSEYHGVAPEQIRAQHAKGASFIDINQQYRRVGIKPRTEQPK